MEHFFENIQGWFTFPELYREMVQRFPSGSHFVEVGSWKGRSAAFMTVEICNSGKTIIFDCIDTWKGSPENLDPTCKGYDPELAEKGDLYQVFLENLSPVRGAFRPFQLDSIQASKKYSDQSLDFVFIDAAHDYGSVYQDIHHWLPKVKDGGVLAGHDYSWSELVRNAVKDFFGDRSGTIRETEGCWVFDK